MDYETYEVYEVRTDTNGNEEYFKNGLLHREDGPAAIFATNRCWYRDGKLHRNDGPAVEYYDGSKYYYKNGEYLTEEKFNKLICENKIREL